MQQHPVRLHSIDIFRAVTMFLMIFVNDVDSVSNIPSWIKHAEASPDRLGFADIIFPAFLFIVGLSIPFAIRNRMSKGASFYQVSGYIFSRSLALIVMGFFQVNLENYSESSILPKAVWEILITISFFLIWIDYPLSMNYIKRRLLQASGVLLLMLMAILFKGGSEQEPQNLQPHWWGILGLIGWSYLVCAVLFLLFLERLPALVFAFLLFLFFNTLAHSDNLSFFDSINSYIHLAGNGSMPSFTMAGVVISVIYTQLTGKGRERLFWMILFFGAIAMMAFGFMTRPLGGISKINDTPSWVGICTGISILAFGSIIYIVDFKGKRHLFSQIKTAGTSTLTCYLIPYFLYSVYALLNFKFPDFLNAGAGGMMRSLATTFIVIYIAGYLEKRKIKLAV